MSKLRFWLIQWLAQSIYDDLKSKYFETDESVQFLIYNGADESLMNTALELKDAYAWQLVGVHKIFGITKDEE